MYHVKPADRMTDADEKHLQGKLFLLNLVLTIFLLYSFYRPPFPYACPATVSVLCVLSGLTYHRRRRFFRHRERGQRTCCAALSTYLGAGLTLACMHVYALRQPLTENDALIFLGAFFFALYMLYRGLGTLIIKGNTAPPLRRN